MKLTLPVRAVLPATLALAALGALAWTACGVAPPTVRDPRPGMLRDAQGRPFYELRRFGTTGCNDAVSGGAREADVRTQLARQAQDQGYSGVSEVRCSPVGGGACNSGMTCTGLAVRYVSGGAAQEMLVGRPCNPPCTGNASCQDSVCVAACDPICGADMLCGPQNHCEPAPRPPVEAGADADASADGR